MRTWLDERRGSRRAASRPTSRRLARVRAAGDDIVASCPTAGSCCDPAEGERLRRRRHQRSVGGPRRSSRCRNTGAAAPSTSRCRADYRGVAAGTTRFFSGDPRLGADQPCRPDLDTGETSRDARGRAARADRAGRRSGWRLPSCRPRRAADRPHPTGAAAPRSGLTVEVVDEGSCCGCGGDLGCTCRWYEPSLAVGPARLAQDAKPLPDAVAPVPERGSSRFRSPGARPPPTDSSREHTRQRRPSGRPRTDGTIRPASLRRREPGITRARRSTGRHRS